LGNAEYRLAWQSVKSLTAVNLNNAAMAMAAGGFASSAIHQGRVYVPKLINGDYQNFSDLAGAYGTDMAIDTVGAGLGMRLSPFSVPFQYAPSIFYGATGSTLRDYDRAKERLEEIDKIMSDLQEPVSPALIRKRYLDAPGRKVDPQLAGKGGSDG